MPSEYLLPRRDECTRVYTTVYPRVHNCIHAYTLPRSEYVLCRARLYVCFLAIIRRISRDGLRLPGIWNGIPEDPKAGVCKRDHTSALIDRIPYWLAIIFCYSFAVVLPHGEDHTNSHPFLYRGGGGQDFARVGSAEEWEYGADGYEWMFEGG